MKELRIGQVLAEHRRRCGITQDQLAAYMGVSKAAVSKWETSSTYPDITLLPQLASFFNISIDQLMGYEPQMPPEGIRRLYRELVAEFTQRPFDQVMARCRETAKKYFACPELLFQLGSLYVNHSPLAGSPARVSDLLEEAMALFARVREQSGNSSLQEQARYMEALCLLQLGRAQQALALLDPPIPLRMCPETLLAMAYQQNGEVQEAIRTLQAGIYQAVVELVNLLAQSLLLCDGPSVFHESVRRLTDLAGSFQLESLHPGLMLPAYYTMIRAYLQWGEPEKALDALELYVRLAQKDIYPLRLKGDAYFTRLDSWLDENLPLGSSLPRDDALFQRDIVQALEHPFLEALQGEERYQRLLRTLKRNERSGI